MKAKKINKITVTFYRKSLKIYILLLFVAPADQKKKRKREKYNAHIISLITALPPYYV